MSNPTELLVLTNQLARDLLATPDTTAGSGAYRNWQTMINQAGDTWRAADPSRATPTPDPFAAVQSMINNTSGPDTTTAGRVDQRTVAMTIQLVQLASLTRSASSRSETGFGATAQRVQGPVLHASYLITHAAGAALRREAAATDDPGLLTKLGRARETVAVAEQILDVHLHRPPGQLAANQHLAVALTRWTTTTHQVLAEQPPEPKNNYIISDVHHGLLVYTAAQLTSQSGSRKLDARDRVLPALQHSAKTWRDIRQTWASLAAPTTGISRPLADAARDLQHALREADLRLDDTPHLLVGTLAAAVHTAGRLADHVRSNQLRTPADVVVNLTRGVLDRSPDTNPYPIWMGLSRHEGRAPIDLPDVLRSELARVAIRNVDAAQTVSSAAHSLLQTSTLTVAAVHRVRTRGVEHTERAPAARPRDPITMSR